ncbi:MAG: peptidoglycan DD-metalloendopeptidase family protein, partial [Chloroflexota bacterium]
MRLVAALQGIRPLLCLIILLMAFALPAAAQTTQCGLATAISFPVDPTQFQIVQDFGAPSPRHQGRYHTGEDWYGGRGSSYGTYVHAIANGQVTFSSPNGWGRDGGVIIIAHAFPDGTTAYSMYGHVTDATGVQFPAPFTCVHMGDVIAAVGAPRPAPHLHFEIRTNQPDIPGPGYTDQDPVDLGWRRPSKFVDNWQAWFLKSSLWHADIADETGPIAPPVELPDHSLLVLDAQRVLRVSNDGRVLWRVNLDEPAVGLIKQESGNMIVYADAKMQKIDADGNRGEAGNFFTGNFDSAPMVVGSEVIFHTKENGLFAFNGDSTWQASGVPPILRWSATTGLLGLMTSDNALLTIPLGGTVVNRALLREPGSLTSDGDLLAYTRGGLWRIDQNGTWALEMPDAPSGGTDSAVAENAQQLFLFDGATLHAYDRAHTQQWATALPGVAGNVTLSIYDQVVLLTSNHGDIVA